MRIYKKRFFDQGVQNVISILHENTCKDMAKKCKKKGGYDTDILGRLVFPQDPKP